MADNESALDAVFARLHAGLPRQAPGSVATTELLLRLAGPLPPQPSILDIGCGPGSSTIRLAELTGGTVTAVDTHRPFLDEVLARAAAAGVSAQVEVLAAAMEELPVAVGGADVIWSEGAAYLMGFDAALHAWRECLAPGGVLVVTEAEYTVAHPSPGVRAFWEPGYPAMRTTAGNVAACLEAGWDLVALYRLPETDWREYYGPLAARIDEFAAQGVDDDLLAPARAEIAVRRDYGGEYGYTAYVLRRV